MHAGPHRKKFHLLHAAQAVPALLWALALTAVIVWTAFSRPGWDVSVIDNAMREVAAGRDPYADGVTQLTRYHDGLQKAPKQDPPFIYVYPPITLPALSVIERLPAWTSHTLYWVAYAASTLALLWVGMQFVGSDERHYFDRLAPVAVFFPGLLVDGTVLSGNIATIFYAAVLLSALHGWRRRAWHWFYLVVLIASCVKGPFLLFALLPALSARRQWVYASLTLAAGAAIVALQTMLWPGMFKNYLRATDLMFRYSHDFGCGPAGLLGDFLSAHGISYSPASEVFYALYAVPLFAILVYLSKKYLSGAFAMEHWVPVMLVGLTLLNPRIIEYDVAPVTIPLALIGWRFLRTFTPARYAAFFFFALFILANGAASYSWELRKLVDGPLIVVLFAVGCWTLLRNSRSSPSRAARDSAPLPSTEHGMAGA
jgi:hypothetical protein